MGGISSNLTSDRCRSDVLIVNFETYFTHCYSVSIIFEKVTAQKIKFSIMDFFSKCDQIRRKLRNWSHLLKKSLMEKFIFCAVTKLQLVNY